MVLIFPTYCCVVFFFISFFLTSAWSSLPFCYGCCTARTVRALLVGCILVFVVVGTYSSVYVRACVRA